MKVYNFSNEALTGVLGGLLDKFQVVAPKPLGKASFTFATLASPEDAKGVTVEYPTTVLPPKRVLLPPREELFTFDKENGPKAVNTAGKPFFFFGLHSYDLGGIRGLDYIFTRDHPESLYIERRKGAIFVGTDYTPDEHHMAEELGIMKDDRKWFDLWVSKTESGYRLDVLNEDGANALAPVLELLGEATEEADYPPVAAHADIDIGMVAGKLESLYHSDIWEGLSEKCFSCGTCNLVCPTCYCFEVDDKVELDLATGKRERRWDGCMLEDFTLVTSGENFRDDAAKRLRHRINKKFRYLTKSTGRSFCIGCGRCSRQCVAGITMGNVLRTVDEAGPANVRASVASRTPIPVPNEVESAELYVPKEAVILEIKDLTYQEKFLTMKFVDGSPFDFKPGQFASFSMYGIGEAPISISSIPDDKETFTIGFRKEGNVTGAMWNLKVGDTIGVRGPFGNGYDVDAIKGQDLLFIGGGCGLFPLRSFILYAAQHREEFGKITVLYGTRGYDEVLCWDDLNAWKGLEGVDFKMTLDQGDPRWEGHTGVITTLIPPIDIDPFKTTVLVTGPPIMYRFVVRELEKKKIPPSQVLFSLERRMKCGVGKCGHCQIHDKYVCQDGPVFSLEELGGYHLEEKSFWRRSC